MDIEIKNIRGEVVGNAELSEAIFGIEPNVTVMHQALVRQNANARRGTHKTKSRGEVRGTTAKWYRQKGTGRARHGDRKAPIFVGGGQAHGPSPRDYTKKMPRKMRRLALRSALSAKAAANEIVVLDDLTFETPRTAQAVEMLESLGVSGSAVILLAEDNQNVEKSTRNLSKVTTIRATYLNIRDLLGHDYVVLPQTALSTVESFLAQ